jgi:hypothetical protein
MGSQMTRFRKPSRQLPRADCMNEPAIWSDRITSERLRSGPHVADVFILAEVVGYYAILIAATLVSVIASHV